MMLYQYRSISSPSSFGYFVDLVTNGSMKFSRPCEFNDPFDCCPTAFSEFPDDQFPHAVGDTLNRGLQSALSLVVGVCCFTLHPNRMLMWSHYGDQHRGVCVGFDRDILLEMVPKNDSGHPLYHEVKKVEYTGVRPGDDDRDCLFKKSDEWRDEDEYRIVSSMKVGSPTSGPGVWSIPVAAIKEVVTGARIAPEMEEGLVTAVKSHRPDIKLKKAVIDMKKFRIHAENMSSQPITPRLVGSILDPNGEWIAF
jgi:DUF2971 family protein